MSKTFKSIYTTYAVAGDYFDIDKFEKKPFTFDSTSRSEKIIKKLVAKAYGIAQMYVRIDSITPITYVTVTTIDGSMDDIIDACKAYGLDVTQTVAYDSDATADDDSEIIAE